MLRKLVAAIAVAGTVGSTLGASSAYALGLGEIQLGSALNQPLEAQIELSDVKGLTKGEILAGMATREDFERAQIERPYFLSSIRFETIVQDNGKAYIKLSSSSQVVEPYLNFLVEVHWPQGRLLREYTLLLDPPAFSKQVVEEATKKPEPPRPAQQPAKQKKQNKQKDKVKIPAAAKKPKPAAAIAPVAPAPQKDGIYRVQKNDTLWEIAASARPDRSVSVNRMMAAIQKKNPQAFIKGNINLLKQGSVLRIPTREEISQFDSKKADKTIAEQNQAWQRRQGRVQVDATRKEQADTSGRGTVKEDRLSIVTANVKDNARKGADQGGGDADAGRVRTLENEISINQEQIDTLSRENTDLKDRLKDLEEQIASLEKLVLLKNDQLTAVQALDKQKTEPGKQQAQLTQEQKDQQQAAAIDQKVDYNYQAPDDSKKEETAAVAAPASQPDNNAGGQQAPEPEPVPPAPVAQPGFVDSLLSNPTIVAAGGGVIALLLALGALIMRRRRQAEEDSAEDEFAERAAVDQPDDFGSETLDPQDYDLDEVQPMAAVSDYEPHLEPEAESADDLLDATRAELDVAVAEQPVDETDLDFNDLDLSLDSESEPQAEAEVAAPAEQISEETFDLDEAELQLGGEGAAGEISVSDTGELEFDVDMLDAIDKELEADLELELDNAVPELGEEVSGLDDTATVEMTTATEGKDDISLDFDLSGDDFDLNEASVTEPQAQAAETPEIPDGSLDFDLSLDELTAGLDDLADEPDSAVAELDMPAMDLDLPAAEPELSVVDTHAPVVEEQQPASGEESAAALDLDAAIDSADSLSDDVNDIDQIEDEFSFLEDTDETATKLDLARAYLEMGDDDGARDILDEVVREGNSDQQSEARGLLEKIDS